MPVISSNIFRDYRPQPELDVLSMSGIDDASDFTEISADARQAAERQMAERDEMAFDDEHVKFIFFLNILAWRMY